MKIYFVSFGCKVNSYETEQMKRVFSESGYEISPDGYGCDVYAVNSCAVTETSVQKIRKELRKLRRENPNAVLALTGCLPQAYKESSAQIPEADIVTGTQNRAELPRLVGEFIKNREKTVSVRDYDGSERFEGAGIGISGLGISGLGISGLGISLNTRAFLKIQDGCEMFCSYCVIPYSRGKFRSKPLGEVAQEVRALSKAGFKEVVLTGINLSFYGREYGLRLADAVSAVCGVEGIERVRLGSLEPEMLADTDIARLSAEKKLCPHFHLSLQSGCEKTLKAMNRRYTPAEYERLAAALRAAFGNCALTTDIMVGFPDESEEDFAESLAFVKKIGFSRAHIFPFSKRKGTKAYNMENQTPSDVKKRRAREMAQAAELSAARFLQSQVGLTVPVLFEEEDGDGYSKGYAPNYTLIKILQNNANKSLRNRIFYVKIERAEKDFCAGFIQAAP